MRDRDLYAQILGFAAPWHVTDVRLDVPAGKVEVIVEHRGDACCPKCGKPCPGYDTRPHRWRHLGDAVNTVRQEEHKQLRADGHRTLVGIKYLWLESHARMRPERRSLLSQLKGICTRTGRAWALKEMAAKLWDYVSPGWA